MYQLMKRSVVVIIIVVYNALDVFTDGQAVQNLSEVTKNEIKK